MDGVTTISDASRAVATISVGAAITFLALSRACRWMASPGLPAAPLLATAFRRGSELSTASCLAALATDALAKQAERSSDSADVNLAQLASAVPTHLHQAEVEDLRAALEQADALDLLESTKTLLASLPNRFALAERVVRWAESEGHQTPETVKALEKLALGLVERFAALLTGDTGPQDQPELLREIHEARGCFLEKIEEIATDDGYALVLKYNPIAELARRRRDLRGLQQLALQEEPPQDFEVAVCVLWQLYLIAAAPLEPSDPRVLGIQDRLVERCDRQAATPARDLMSFRSDSYEILEALADLWPSH